MNISVAETAICLRQLLGSIPGLTVCDLWCTMWHQGRFFSEYFDFPGSSVGIATTYGLDGPGIESRWGRDFSHLSRPALRPTQPPVQLVPGLSRG